MISEFDPQSRSDRFGTKINRDHLPLLVHGIPILTILLGSLTPMLPVISAGPVVPPMGFMILLAWLVIRPGLLPPWIGLPLGAFDDLFSGQPFGSAILFWSLAILTFELLEARFPWRGFWQEWLTASAVLVCYLGFGALLAGVGFDMMRLGLVVPQVIVSVLFFPLVARLVAACDRLRLLRVRVLR
jgi:rod shape-determining protein MreD